MVRIESTPGAGTTVYVYLPLGKKNIAEEDTGCCRVLILDDDEMMRIIIKRMFEHFNCDGISVNTGEDAIKEFTRNDGKKKCYDMVLLDLNIDKGMSGTDAAAEIHALAPQTIMVAMSGDREDEVMLHYKKYHFTAAIAKPFSIDTVEELLNIYARQATV